MKAEWLWDKLARNWDKPGINLGENDIKLIEKTKKYLNPGSVYLDYGCATGSTALAISPSVKQAYGIDISSVMIEKARRKAAGKPNTTFIHGTINDKRLGRESFDVITAFSILHLVSGYRQAIRQIRALLKPDAWLVIEAPCLGENRFPNILLNIPVWILSKIGLLQKLSRFSAAQLIKEVTEAGFEILENEYTESKPVTIVFIAARKKGR